MVVLHDCLMDIAVSYVVTLTACSLCICQ